MTCWITDGSDSKISSHNSSFRRHPKMPGNSGPSVSPKSGITSEKTLDNHTAGAPDGCGAICEFDDYLDISTDIKWIGDYKDIEDFLVSDNCCNFGTTVEYLGGTIRVVLSNVIVEDCLMPEYAGFKIIDAGYSVAIFEKQCDPKYGDDCWWLCNDNDVVVDIITEFPADNPAAIVAVKCDLVGLCGIATCISGWFQL